MWESGLSCDTCDGAAMKIVVTEQLKKELTKYQLRYRCGECVFFMSGTGQYAGQCVHGWPNERQRDQSPHIDDSHHLCKDFELL